MSCSQRRDPSQNQQDDIQVALPLMYILLQLFFSFLCVSESCKVVKLFKSCKFVRCDGVITLQARPANLFCFIPLLGVYSYLMLKQKTKEKTKLSCISDEKLIKAELCVCSGMFGYRFCCCLGTHFAVLLFLAFVY